jgi:hypothetical protein
MHRGQRPRNLRDISHLYLTSPRATEEERPGYSALVLIVSLEGGALRAWLSAGLAAALGSQNAAVTLLETGPGMPCAGYYFALAPGRYLGPVLEPGSVVEAGHGRSVVSVYSRDPALLIDPGTGYAAGPRIVLVAFEWEGAACDPVLAGLLDSIPALGGSGRWAGLPAFLLTVSDHCPVSTEEIRLVFEGLFPGGESLSLYPGGVEGGAPPGIEPSPFPVEMLRDLPRRRPPASSFMSGLAGEVIQRLGSKRRGAAGDGK